MNSSPACGRNWPENKSCNSFTMLGLRGVLGAQKKMAVTKSLDNFTYCEVFSMRKHLRQAMEALPGCSERNCSLDRHCRGGSLAQF